MNRDNLCLCNSNLAFEKCCGINIGANYFEMEYYVQNFRINQPLYRFFDKKEWADSFYNGDIRLSTLNICRNHENLFARDELEAKANVTLSYLPIADSNDEKNQMVLNDLASMGIPILDSKNIIIRFISGGQRQIDDAYILCFSTDNSDFLDKRFGKFCIKINQPKILLYLIWAEVKRLKLAIQVKEGKIEYDNNLAIDISRQRINDKLGFIKREIFSPEN